MNSQLFCLSGMGMHVPERPHKELGWQWVKSRKSVLWRHFYTSLSQHVKWLVLNDWGFYFSLFSLSLFFPKQKRAWDGWCSILRSWARRSARLITRLVGKSLPRSRVGGLNHHGAQGACVGALRGHRWPLLLPSWGKLLPIARLWRVVLVLMLWVFVFAFVFFPEEPDHFSFPLRWKQRERTPGKLSEAGGTLAWFSVPTWFPSLPPEVCTREGRPWGK